MPTVSSTPPLVLINAVGLTRRWLPYAEQFQALAASGWCVSLREVLPAVTCTAQAAMLTGQPVRGHGIVGNGWFWRETGEVRFWLQANQLLQAEPIYQTARRIAHVHRHPFRSAKLFWWFNQGAAVDLSLTPKPYYGADGNKVFAVQSTPAELADSLEKRLGPFPFHAFWGPLAGLPSTEWIARSAADILRTDRPDLTLVYLPHLDYDPQRFGPDDCDMPELVGQLDRAAGPLLEAARLIGARIWVVSEYGHVPVRRAVSLNRVLRQAELLAVRPGPFGENLDPFASRAFAVCDHQVAHVYVRDPVDRVPVRERIAQVPGVASVLDRDDQINLGLDHPRSGDLIALANPDAWFSYPFWLDDDQAPDYAPTVDIHRKPGYDPCELFFNPQFRWPRGRTLKRLLQKKLGFRTLFDVVPLDPGLVRGSHGLPAADPLDRPILIGDGPPPSGELTMMDVHGMLKVALDLAGS